MRSIRCNHSLLRTRFVQWTPLSNRAFEILTTFNWLSIKKAVDIGVEAQSPKSLEQCLGQMISNSIDGEARRSEIDALFPGLSSGLVRCVMEHERDTRLSILQSMVPKLIKLHNGYNAAFSMFLQVYRVEARHVLPLDVWGNGFQFCSDELLLSICRACPLSSKLAIWREAMSTAKFKRRYGCMPGRLLPRSMQYIYEMHAQHTFAMLSAKVVRFTLPRELEDAIHEQLLIDSNVVPESDHEAVWRAYTGAYLPSRSRSIRDLCCGFDSTSQELEYLDRTVKHDAFATDILRWSRAQHKYVLYHVDPDAPEGLHVLRKSNLPTLWEQRGRNRVYRKCRTERWEPLADSTQYAAGFFPFRNYESRDFLFEVESECEWSHELNEADLEDRDGCHEEGDHGSDSDLDEYDSGI